MEFTSNGAGEIGCRREYFTKIDHKLLSVGKCNGYYKWGKDTLRQPVGVHATNSLVAYSKKLWQFIGG